VNDLDLLWAKFVGSHKLSEFDELKMLRVVRENKVLSWKQVYTLFLQSKRWKNLRKAVLRRDDWCCVECKSKYLLQVDHLKYPEILGEESLDDLKTLCLECHAKKTKKYDLKAMVSKRKVPVNGGTGTQLFMILRSRGKK